MSNVKAIDYLNKDKRLAKIIQEVQFDSLHELKWNGPLRDMLIYSIISQQLNTKVAKVIQQRFLKYYKGKFPSNARILKTPDEELRSIGLSFQKLNYIKNIALFFQEQKLKDENLIHLSNEELILLLTKIKGVGQWTVEMVLMFSLGREDVFSSGDYGIQLAMKKVYKLDLEGKALKEKILSISEKWKPYRTIACLYLWAHKDST